MAIRHVEDQLYVEVIQTEIYLAVIEALMHEIARSPDAGVAVASQVALAAFEKHLPGPQSREVLRAEPQIEASSSQVVGRQRAGEQLRLVLERVRGRR